MPLELFLKVGGNKFQLPIKIPQGAPEVCQQGMPFVKKHCFQLFHRTGFVVDRRGHGTPRGVAGAQQVEHHIPPAAGGNGCEQLPKSGGQAGEAKHMQRSLLLPLLKQLFCLS